ncbi:MAG: MFS transporter [Tannerella sp.]|jgi:fucose permease|nr:MFS transporter [Tannerella sp.]
MEKTNRSVLYKTLPVFMAFYVMGFGDIVGVATSYTKLEFGLSNTLTQVLTMLAFVWFALLSVPIGVFQDKRGKKFTVNLGIIFIGLGMLVPIVAYNYYGMLASFTLLGIGNTIIQVSSNPLMQDVSPKDKLSRNLTFSQFVKAIAGMLGPFIAAYCALRFGNWTLVYWVYLIICIITIIWLKSTSIPEAGSEGRASIINTLKLLGDKKVALLVLGTFLMVGFDVGMNTNIVNYLRESFTVSQEEGSVGISIYFAALMVGRFLSAIILNKMKGNKMLFYCAVLSVASFALLYFMPNFISGQVAIFCIGLFTAAIFPLIFSAGLQYLPERANELSGLMIMSVCGGGIIPPVVGLINDFSGLMTALLLLGLCLVYVIYLSLYIIKNKL